MVGEKVDGTAVGAAVGSVDGVSVVGEAVEGKAVGISVGNDVGIAVGSIDGSLVDNIPIPSLF